jgi:hypothetical protein
VHARDAVRDGEDRAHLGQVGAAVLETLDAVLEDAGDLVWLDLHESLLIMSGRTRQSRVLRLGGRPSDLLA